jgi:peroxiredoxin
MTQLESQRASIEAAGAQLAFLAAEKRDGMWKPAKFLEKHPIASVFLLDEDRDVTKAYGLYHALGAGAIRIAHPATLVIDRSGNGPNESYGGVVRYIYRGDNQLDRAPLEEVLRVLQEKNN